MIYAIVTFILIISCEMAFPTMCLNIKQNDFSFLLPFQNSYRTANVHDMNNNLPSPSSSSSTSSSTFIKSGKNLRMGTRNYMNKTVLHSSSNENINGKYISSLTSDYKKFHNVNIDDIKKYLPHRYPFLLVDKVIHIEDNHKIIGIKQVSVNENYFNGHFPQKPIMPGVLQIEALAQLGGILCLKGNSDNETDKSNEFKEKDKTDTKDNIFLFAGVDGVKWRHPVLPGDTLVMEAEKIFFKSHLGIVKLKGAGYVSGRLVVEVAEMLFALSK